MSREKMFRPGGEPADYLPHTPETKAKMRAAAKERAARTVIITLSIKLDPPDEALRDRMVEELGKAVNHLEAVLKLIGWKEPAK